MDAILLDTMRPRGTLHVFDGRTILLNDASNGPERKKFDLNGTFGRQVDIDSK
jgi:hypothetical protein